ncbi:MAG: response regulator transcription factor [Algicola sp.]|nr:response regulator transcription factor [Algicola sp.]
MRNCLIIENDAKTIKSIKATLLDFPEFTYDIISPKYEDALNEILRANYDLVFLTIDNDAVFLTDLANNLRQYGSKMPELVAMSTSKNLAYEAFQNDFFDYLLKPMTELNIRKCLLKYQKRFPSAEEHTICLKSYKDYQYLDTKEILFLKADNNATDFYMSDGSVICAFKTLKTFENLLPNNFMRIHKSYIINRNCINRIQYGKNICFTKDNEHKIPFTKTFIDNIDAINGLLSKNTIVTLN